MSTHKSLPDILRSKFIDESSDTVLKTNETETCLSGSISRGRFSLDSLIRDHPDSLPRYGVDYVVALAGCNSNLESCKSLLDKYPEQLLVVFVSKGGLEITKHALSIKAVELVDSMFGDSYNNIKAQGGNFSEKILFLLEHIKPTSRYSRSVVARTKVSDGLSLDQVLEGFPEEEKGSITYDIFSTSIEFENQAVFDAVHTTLNPTKFHVNLALTKGDHYARSLYSKLGRSDKKEESKELEYKEDVFINFLKRGVSEYKTVLKHYVPSDFTKALLSAIETRNLDLIKAVQGDYKKRMVTIKDNKTDADFARYARDYGKAVGMEESYEAVAEHFEV